MEKSGSWEEESFGVWEGELQSTLWSMDGMQLGRVGGGSFVRERGMGMGMGMDGKRDEYR